MVISRRSGFPFWILSLTLIYLFFEVFHRIDLTIAALKPYSEIEFFVNSVTGNAISAFGILVILFSNISFPSSFSRAKNFACYTATTLAVFFVLFFILPLIKYEIPYSFIPDDFSKSRAIDSVLIKDSVYYGNFRHPYFLTDNRGLTSEFSNYLSILPYAVYGQTDLLNEFSKRRFDIAIYNEKDKIADMFKYSDSLLNNHGKEIMELDPVIDRLIEKYTKYLILAKNPNSTYVGHGSIWDYSGICFDSISVVAGSSDPSKSVKKGCIFSDENLSSIYNSVLNKKNKDNAFISAFESKVGSLSVYFADVGSGYQPFLDAICYSNEKCFKNSIHNHLNNIKYDEDYRYLNRFFHWKMIEHILTFNVKYTYVDKRKLRDFKFSDSTRQAIYPVVTKHVAFSPSYKTTAVFAEYLRVNYPYFSYKWEPYVKRENVQSSENAKKFLENEYNRIDQREFFFNDNMNYDALSQFVTAPWILFLSAFTIMLSLANMTIHIMNYYLGTTKKRWFMKTSFIAVLMVIPLLIGNQMATEMSEKKYPSPTVYAVKWLNNVDVIVKPFSVMRDVFSFFYYGVFVKSFVFIGYQVDKPYIPKTTITDFMLFVEDQSKNKIKS